MPSTDKNLIAVIGALMALAASVAYPQSPQAPPDPNAPDFRMQLWGDIVMQFNARVSAYVELRSELEKSLPALRVTEDRAETMRAERALARRIRIARAEAKQGDIFTPATGVEFKKALVREMDADTWAAIMDDNPGEFHARINGTYPQGKPLSTVPANILAALPKLPDDIQYRFLGRHLVLLDTRARVMLDRIPNAIERSDSDTTDGR